jgi:hypothetical protein
MTHHEFGPLPDGPLNAETEVKFNKLKFQLQIDLMKEYMKDHGETDDMSPKGFELTQEWVKRYSAKLKNIFHRKVATDPHFKDNAEIIPDAVYEEIKLELYHEDGKVNAEEYLDDDSGDLKKAA